VASAHSARRHNGSRPSRIRSTDVRTPSTRANADGRATSSTDTFRIVPASAATHVAAARRNPSNSPRRQARVLTSATGSVRFRFTARARWRMLPSLFLRDLASVVGTDRPMDSWSGARAGGTSPTADQSAWADPRSWRRLDEPSLRRGRRPSRRARCRRCDRRLRWLQSFKAIAVPRRQSALLARNVVSGSSEPRGALMSEA
jgi:hypothetical protein